MREITHIVMHCTATKPDMDIGAATIDEWHKNKGWSGIGYHYVVRRNGNVEDGRPIEKAGAHVKGMNTPSIGVALVGGVASDGKTSEDNFTPEQMTAASKLALALMEKYDVPLAKVMGHKEVIEQITHGSPKDCPVFDMDAFRSSIFQNYEPETSHPIYTVEEYASVKINIAVGLDIYVSAATKDEAIAKANRVMSYIK